MAPSVAYPPSGRRRRWVTAASCPFCHGVHLHRGSEDAPSKGLRHAGCCRRIYWLVIVATSTAEASGVVA
jgi:hypothetical protein